MLRTITLRLPANLSTLLLGLLVVSLAVLSVNPAGAQVSTPEAGEDALYRDPQGRFAIPVPTNWTAEEHDGYVSIVTNDKKITISLVLLPGTSATAAIEDAMGLVGSASSGAPLAPLATPSSAGDEVAFFTYDDGVESGQMIQAFGQRVGQVVFVLVLHGEREAIGLRQVQVDKILSGVQVFPEALGTPLATPVS